MAAAAPRVTPVTLELGGKDAFVVCGDADLSQVGGRLHCGANLPQGVQYHI